MGRQANETKPIKHICAGLLAHVDAGKTTLSREFSIRPEACGSWDGWIMAMRFLTILRWRGAGESRFFPSRPVFPLGETEVTLIDTPGHVDFSAEMERTLQGHGLRGAGGERRRRGAGTHRDALAAAESGSDSRILFVNKMDQDGTDREALLQELRTRLSDGCVDCSADVETSARDENIAMCDEVLLEQYLEHGSVNENDIVRLVAARRLFPCYFGAALRLDGIDALLDGLARFGPQPVYPDAFGARVFKIARDEQGNRLTYLKVTGGVLRVKDTVGDTGEKVNQIRIYSGVKYQTVNEAPAGTVCAVTGLTGTHPGQGLGEESMGVAPVLEPVLTYRVVLPDGCDAHTMLGHLRQLEDEDPMLRVVWNETLGELHVQLMGEVQLEVLTQRMQERFGLAVSFDSGNIVYKETIAAPVLGVGHFEPLRHYAETHLLLEPGERGSGMQYATRCSTDALDVNWQRLILTHLAEKTHVGVLTGAPVTDLKITLLAGRAHLKHTEGGDFRQATYRAVRQGLMQAQSILLEPYYAFGWKYPPKTWAGR